MKKEVNSNSTSGFGVGFLAGAIVGLVAGILLAPRPGGETRQQIREKAGAAVGKIRERVGELREKRSQGQDIVDEEE